MYPLVNNINNKVLFQKKKKIIIYIRFSTGIVQALLLAIHYIVSISYDA